MVSSSLVSSVRGALRGAGADWVDIDIGGVTLRVNVPNADIGAVGDTVRLHTSLQVREDSLTLFGFLSADERQTFETLIGISRIGPRLALAMLTRFEPADLAAAVEAADTKALASVPGIGARTASRIVLELKGKLELDFAETPATSADAELVDALTALGYSESEAREAAANASADLPEEERLRAALGFFAGG